jgi:signal transduction histidine kinase
MMQVAAHDLRNLLNNLNLLLRVVKTGVQNKPGIASLMPVANKDIEMMRAIIQDYLTPDTLEANGVSHLLEKGRVVKLLEQG